MSSKESWPKALSDVEFALNNTFSKKTEATPSVLLFEVEREKIVDYVKENVLDEDCIKRNITEIRDNAAERITKSQSCTM